MRWKTISNTFPFVLSSEWITKRVPAFNKWFLKQENFDNLKPEFEYWSTSGFTDDALEKLKTFQVQGKYKITIVGPAEIMQLAEESRNKKLKDALNTFYLNSEV